jgi:hypothetical protein
MRAQYDPDPFCFFPVHTLAKCKLNPLRWKAAKCVWNRFRSARRRIVCSKPGSGAVDADPLSFGLDGRHSELYSGAASRTGGRNGISICGHRKTHGPRCGIHSFHERGPAQQARRNRRDLDRPAVAANRHQYRSQIPDVVSRFRNLGLQPRGTRRTHSTSNRGVRSRASAQRKKESCAATWSPGRAAFVIPFTSASSPRNGRR